MSVDRVIRNNKNLLIVSVKNASQEDIFNMVVKFQKLTGSKHGGFILFNNKNVEFLTFESMPKIETLIEVLKQKGYLKECKYRNSCPHEDTCKDKDPTKCDVLNHE